MTEHYAIAVALNARVSAMTLVQRLIAARDAIAGRLVFTTSFGLEDQVLADALHEAAIDAAWVTLDTGRLFPQAYDVWAATEQRYARRIEAFMPEPTATAALVAAIGINGFYDSSANRHACCGVRKVVPLAATLLGAAGWITGLRAEQSPKRDGAPFAAVDPARDLLKLNPLFDWSRDALLEIVERRAIPINPLHAVGFASIGCAPCTRAIQPGEPERAGRWWWEADAARECGLHVDSDGRLSRAAPEFVG